MKNVDDENEEETVGQDFEAKKEEAERKKAEKQRKNEYKQRQKRIYITLMAGAIFFYLNFAKNPFNKWLIILN